ncbi:MULTISPECIES: hypothetical protein [Pseudomonas]|jgi:hypothetical protein|uniref:hypothetical protein n=1 Tax=Pseudomonas TaxID=286 RepID=UPI00249A0C77|nr:hypothetical protein [Pseudomonas sp. PS02290]
MITSAEEFVVLRSSEIKAEYDRAAMEEAPSSVWREVIKKYPEYLRWVVHNKTVPLEILEELCVVDADSRPFIARKRKLSSALFESLSQDVNSSVRLGIASNKKTPGSILERLIHDDNEAVARLARRNYETRKR